MHPSGYVRQTRCQRTPTLQKTAAQQTPPTQNLHEAASWLRKAGALDPADPWYFYELGRLSHTRDACLAQQENRSDRCPAARYFLTALHNAPNNMFLREAVGRWFYDYDRDTAHQLLRKIIARETIIMPEHPEISHKYSKFLYDIHLDYESDREAKHLLHRAALPNVLRHSPGNQEIELGNDDGTVEWSTRLGSETLRVKKIISLPGNLEKYDSAALKVYMNNGGNEDFIARIGIDDQLIKTYEQTVSRTAQWYEIPFDTSLLQGKSSINVYIRVTDVSAAGNYLQIWGDQDTPTAQSVFNFNTTDDLSFDKGIQTGEYMIRLVLKK